MYNTYICACGVEMPLFVVEIIFLLLCVPREKKKKQRDNWTTLDNNEPNIFIDFISVEQLVIY